jgi:UDP-N-acetylglucosamine 4,6-dehydratase
MPARSAGKTSFWEDRTVLVTGGTGSFGRKFAEITLRQPIRKMIIFSRDELKQHEMRTGGFDDSRLRYFIGDVRDSDRLRRAMEGVDIVVHAAALKQVPACEYNPMEAIMTNVLGARNIVDAALDSGVQRAVAISTDKAVNPINLYGATKLCAEKLFIQSNSYAGTKDIRFSCVRYGNVVGSRGSVIPLFLEQRKSGMMTITDTQMTRFWITLEQGARFVARCIEDMHGGEVFVPKIPSMNIVELVHALAPEARIDVIGIRPGEKIHELLVSEDEARHCVEFDDMFVIEPTHPWWSREKWSHGKRPTDGFRYGSDTNPQKVSVGELRKMVAELEVTD